MWGPEDTFGRWVQFVCGLAATGLATGIWLIAGFGIYEVVAIGVLLYLAARCLWYAATGRNNLNSLDN